MAIFFECDFCGKAIYRDHEWVRLRVEESATTARALDRMGLDDAAERARNSLHFHSDCFDGAVRLLDDRRDWAEASEEMLAGRGLLPAWSLSGVPVDGGEAKAPPTSEARETVPWNERCVVGGCVRRRAATGGRCIEHAEAMKARRRRERLGTSVHELSDDLGTDITWLLWHADVATIEELTSRTPDQVLAIKRIGRKRLAAITEALAKRGLALHATPAVR